MEPFWVLSNLFLISLIVPFWNINLILPLPPPPQQSIMALYCSYDRILNQNSQLGWFARLCILCPRSTSPDLSIFIPPWFLLSCHTCPLYLTFSLSGIPFGFSISAVWNTLYSSWNILVTPSHRLQQVNAYFISSCHLGPSYLIDVDQFPLLHALRIQFLCSKFSFYL